MELIKGVNTTLNYAVNVVKFLNINSSLFVRIYEFNLQKRRSNNYK